MGDASAAERLGRAVGRHLPSARGIAGLTLVLASLGMLGLFLWVALVPFEYESSGPPLGEVCADRQPTLCVEVDDEALDEAFEDRVNHDNRVIGLVGAVTSCAALALGWRLWRSRSTQGTQTVRGARTLLAAACLSPVAAALILATAVALYWGQGLVSP